MARPSDIETKTVATRIPMAKYISILEECHGKGRSISEWLTMKIYSDNDQKAEVESLQNELSAALKTVKTLKAKKPQTKVKEVVKEVVKSDPKVKAELAKVKKENAALNEDLAAVRRKFATSKDNKETLEARLKRANAYLKENKGLFSKPKQF